MCVVYYRQLVSAFPGTPVFEMFVVKNADGTYSSQVIHKAFVFFPCPIKGNYKFIAWVGVA